MIQTARPGEPARFRDGITVPRRSSSFKHRFLQLLGASACVVLGAANAPASAESRTYSYSVVHAKYGTIGTYADTIDESGGKRQIDTKLRVAVKVLGFTLYREEADRTELWEGGHLISFHGSTIVDGKPLEVRGEARSEGFAITSPSGTIIAPLNIYTSSPWSVELPKPDVMMSTKTGRVERVQVIDDGVSLTTINGSAIPLHHYRILSNKRQDAWVDAGGVPVRFRSEEHGSAVDFVLKPECFSAMMASRR